MLKKLALVAALAAVAVAGCSSPGAMPPPAPASSVMPSQPSVPVESSSPTPTSAVITDNGNIAKKIGEIGGLVGGGNEADPSTWAVRFRVTKITPDYKCTGEFARKSENGHFVAIWMEIWTTKSVSINNDSANAVPYFNTTDWVIIGPDGVEENDDYQTDAAMACAKDTDALKVQYQGAHHVKGVVVLDTKYNSGAAVLRQDYASENGWEYDF